MEKVNIIDIDGEQWDVQDLPLTNDVDENVKPVLTLTEIELQGSIHVSIAGEWRYGSQTRYKYLKRIRIQMSCNLRNFSILSGREVLRIKNVKFLNNTNLPDFSPTTTGGTLVMSRDGDDVVIRSSGAVITGGSFTVMYDGFDADYFQ